MREVVSEIEELRREKNAVILAHNYQRPEIQDIADYMGDSLGLSREASRTDAEVIIFCGVDFMAETAAIINPDKKVLMPAKGALCPMANMLTVDELLRAKKEHPDVEVVLYINTHADVKAYVDCICTSANADKIVNAMRAEKILFGPDMNLAYYVQKRTEKEIIPVPEYGICPTHHQISEWDIVEAKEGHPDALIVVHPETIPEIQEMADHIASTEGIMKYCKNSKAKDFIIGTENGILHRLKKEIPGKKFYYASETAVCPTMKMITLESVRDSLKETKHEVKIPKEIADKARTGIERMLELTR